ncbi:putative toxin-antitoxin system toxin component, PIN family [Candidatus Daviesbacteria bacterium]|nr:putative toxin-antitoxin system toxin component, PIN family [Candidatus Daviesbacteria bacterium]
MRIVLDTNILISASLKGALAGDILDMAATTFLITLLTSEEIIQELADKLLNKFNWNEDRVNYFIKELRQVAEIVDTTEKVSVISRDPQDNKILECGISGQADLIVTSDQDLIKLKKYKGIGIIHPKTLSWTFPEYFRK